MARPRTSPGRAPSGGIGTLDRGRPFFTAADVVALARHSRKDLTAGADTEALAGRLTLAAEEFVALSRREAQDSPGDAAKRAREVERQARALLAAFGLREDRGLLSPAVVYAVFREQPAEDRLARDHLGAMLYHLNARWFGEDPDHIPRPSGQEAFRAAVEGVCLIARRMELAALAYAANATAKATREVLWPELRLFGTLCAIYTAAFGGPPSYSAKRTTPIGDIPGVRFCREVIRLILERHDTVDPELDSRLLERLATLMRSPHAVRERILEALRGGSHRKR